MSVNATVIPSIAVTDQVKTWLVSANLSYSRIYDIVNLLNSIESDLYSVAPLSLNDLLTSNKNSIIESINSLWSDVNSGAALTAITGDLSLLTTTNKSTLVAAINELDAEHGDLSNLNTTDKNTFVGAINELYTLIGGAVNLAALHTIDKSSLVAAINETFDKIGNAALTTVAQTSREAINELHTEIAANSTAISAISGSSTGFYSLDGAVPITADMQFGNHKGVNLLAGVNPTDAVNVAQVADLAGSGDLSGLLTTDNSDLVAAINELYNTKVTKTSDTGSAVIPKGTTAQRDSVSNPGYFRYNTDLGSFEGNIAGTWKEIGNPDNATYTATGVLEIATPLEISNSVSYGSNGPLAMTPNNMAGAVVMGTGAANALADLDKIWIRKNSDSTMSWADVGQVGLGRSTVSRKGVSEIATSAEIVDSVQYSLAPASNPLVVSPHYWYNSLNMTPLPNVDPAVDSLWLKDPSTGKMGWVTVNKITPGLTQTIVPIGPTYLTTANFPHTVTVSDNWTHIYYIESWGGNIDNNGPDYVDEIWPVNVGDVISLNGSELQINGVNVTSTAANWVITPLGGIMNTNIVYIAPNQIRGVGFRVYGMRLQ